MAYLNDSDPAPEKRVSTDSRPLREVLGATYELPVNAMMILQSGPVNLNPNQPNGAAFNTA